MRGELGTASKLARPWPHSRRGYGMDRVAALVAAAGPSRCAVLTPAGRVAPPADARPGARLHSLLPSIWAQAVPRLPGSARRALLPAQPLPRSAASRSFNASPFDLLPQVTARLRLRVPTCIPGREGVWSAQAIQSYTTQRAAGAVADVLRNATCMWTGWRVLKVGRRVLAVTNSISSRGAFSHLGHKRAQSQGGALPPPPPGWARQLVAGEKGPDPGPRQSTRIGQFGGKNGRGQARNNKEEGRERRVSGPKRPRGARPASLARGAAARARVAFLVSSGHVQAAAL